METPDDATTPYQWQPLVTWNDETGRSHTCVIAHPHEGDHECIRCGITASFDVLR